MTLDGDDFVGEPSGGTGRAKAPARPKKAPGAAAKRADARGGARSAAQTRVWTARWHRVLRIGIQIAFFVLAPGLFAAAFNGVKYLFGQIGVLEPFEATSFVMVLLALLAFTVVFGRFFCGYACAFGALGDWVYAVVHGVLSRTPLRNARIPEGAMKALSLVKYGVAIAIAAACVLGVWADVSGYSPWVAFAGFTSGSLDGIRKGAFVLLGLCVAGMALSERFFCRVFCPMGAVFALMPVLGVSAFTRTRAHCARKCGKCHEACPVGLWPDADTLAHGECIACGRCADACPLSNVNLVALPKQAGRAELQRALEKAKQQADRNVRAASSSAATASAEDAASPRVLASAGAASAEVSAPFGAADRLSPAERAVARKQAFSEAWGQGRPVRKTRKGWLMLHGSGTAVVLVKAAALLALCWAVGVTRYLPSFGEVVAAVPWPF